jgi:3-hydroxyisobutyrate dehydrogenase
MHYGYIGLGNLGAACAGCLVRDGFQVTVHDLNPALTVPGATRAARAEEVAASVDHVITCLPSPAVSERVLRNILPHMKKTASWVEMSTLGRDEVLMLAAIAAEHGIRMMELPVTGGVHLAHQGKITMLAGGERDLYETHHKAMQAMGDKIFHMGPLGSSAIIKVITNMLAFIHLKATSEALMLAKRGGLDLAQAWHAIKASSGNSFVHETEGALILNGSYDIAFNMDLALKDLGFALGFGKEFGVPLDLAAMTHQTYIAAKAAYGGEAQSPMIAKLLEDLLGTDLRATGFPSRLE